jgi:hypothetical protein
MKAKRAIFAKETESEIKGPGMMPIKGNIMVDQVK